jgi:S-adenosylmethionine hydrolase
MAHPPLFFLTDFGLSDPYVGIMKGVALTLGHEGQIVDLVHNVPPQDVLAGAVAVEDSLPWLPPRCVVVAVVDPGVGTDRGMVAVKSGERIFVAPDNGLLTPVLQQEGAVARGIQPHGPIKPAQSATFHGRDVFTPAATLMATGVRSFEQIGPVLQKPQHLEFPKLEVLGSGALLMTILHVDHFGNMAVNLRTGGVPEGFDLALGTFQFAQTDLGPLRRTFGDVEPGKPVVYFNAADRLEVAISMGNASEFFSAGPYDTILFHPREGQ